MWRKNSQCSHNWTCQISVSFTFKLFVHWYDRMVTHRWLHRGGVSITITALRQVYWIPSARQYIRKLLWRCFTYTKLLGKPNRAPDPPPLPKICVTESLPITVTGVDFTVALYIKDRTEESKMYICVFICATASALHIEVVTDLTVDTFLLAFRRFSSRKSLPSTVISDNASTFLAVVEDFQRLFESEALEEEPGCQNVTWHFIPKRAPWLLGENDRSNKASHQEDIGKDICDPLSENPHSLHNFQFFKKFSKDCLQCLRSEHSKFQLNQAEKV